MSAVVERRFDDWARVRAVVLNFNGGAHVLRCIEHLTQTEWPADRFEIVVVDNDSSDGSDAEIARRFPGIRLVQTGANLGFPANNVAMRDLDGVDYVALVNNDAFVDPGWLAPLVAAFDEDPGLGAACPLILFAPSFHTLEVSAPTFRPPGDGRDLALRLHGVRVGDDDRTGLVHVAADAWGIERSPDGSFRWLGGRALLRIPVDAGSTGYGTVELLLSAEREKDVTLTCTDYRVHVRVGTEPVWVRVPYEGPAYDVVNNAGSVLIDDGSGGDRGFGEVDAGQFVEPVDVFNWCGGGVLLRRRYLEEVGLFDERFFLYYEDTDLSWRGRAQGWRYRFVPSSVFRHLHGASAGEGSDLFHHFVERNRLLMLLKNAPPSLAFGAPARYLLSTASYARRDIAPALRHGRRPPLHDVLRRTRSFAAYLKFAPAMLADRRELRRRQVVPDAELASQFLPRALWGVPTRRVVPVAEGGSVDVGTRGAHPRGDRPAVCVYDRWWSTAGGGEKFAGGIADVLSRSCDVTLLTHEPVDLDQLSERLQIDLARVAVRRIDLAPDAVSEATEDYDLLVNASYTSTAENRAGAGLYVVHFPTDPGGGSAGWRRRAVGALGPLVAEPGVELRFARGFHPEEQMGRHRAQWTTGDAELEVVVPPGRSVPLSLVFGRFLGYGVPPASVEVTVDGEPAGSVEVGQRANRFDTAVVALSATVVGHDDGSPVRVGIRSDHHVPATLFGTPDTRRLGVPLVTVRLGSGPRAVVKARYPSLAGRRASLSWLDSYDTVVSNSEYTRTWVRRWWGVDSEVLNPPVTLQPRLPKEQIILNVGRFFAAEHGHSKKQLELVGGFRLLRGRGLEGWELHLVGGCSEVDRPYLDEVRAAAEGLPVVIHEGAPGSELRDLYGRASIYWHASGLGEDDERHPDRFEHFGITTVEAMSAGAVPVVIGRAGQLEVLEHGVSGYHWESLSGLAYYTQLLTDDAVLRSAMSSAAEERARRYGTEAFAGRLEGIVEGLLSEPSRGAR